jgi:hypothetical protein
MMPPATLSSSSEVIASPLMVAKSVMAVSLGYARHGAVALAGHYLFRPDPFVSQITQLARRLGGDSRLLETLPKSINGSN